MIAVSLHLNVDVMNLLSLHSDDIDF